MKIAWVQGLTGAIAGAAIMWVLMDQRPPVVVSGILESDTTSGPTLPGPYVNSRIYVMRGKGLAPAEFGKIISGSGHIEVQCQEKNYCYPFVHLK